MTSVNLKSAIWLILAAGAVTLAGGGAAFGKGPPPDKGNKPPTEATNNLSVPAIMAGRVGAFTLTCSSGGFSALTPPDTDPLHYPEACATSRDGTESCVTEGDYYVQRSGTWQAPCTVVSSATALGAWGDNLAGDAMLKVGSPIRVELVLWDYTALGETALGYHVIKLEPSELDRVSDYGHWAAGEEGSWAPVEYAVGETYADVPDVVYDFVGMFGAVVHDPDAILTIQRVDEDGNAVGDPAYDGPAGGEINATGKIVYGYNLRVDVAGTYRLTYTLPNVQLSGCKDGKGTCTGNTASLDIVVIAGGGGGKKSREQLTVTERIQAQEQEQLQVQDQVRTQ